MKASDKESSPFSLVGKQLHRVTSLEARMRTNLEKRGADAKKRGTFVVLTDDMVQEAKVKALQAGVDGVNQNCAAYTDLVTPWMTQNNKTCDGWDWLANVGYNTRCDSDTQSGGDSWVANQYCWKTCCELGVGYTPGEIQEETKTAIDNLTKTDDDLKVQLENTDDAEEATKLEEEIETIETEIDTCAGDCCASADEGSLEIFTGTSCGCSGKCFCDSLCETTFNDCCPDCKESGISPLGCSVCPSSSQKPLCGA